MLMRFELIIVPLFSIIVSRLADQYLAGRAALYDTHETVGTPGSSFPFVHLRFEAPSQLGVLLLTLEF